MAEVMRQRRKRSNDHAAHERWLAVVRTGKRQVAVGQAASTYD